MIVALNAVSLKRLPLPHGRGGNEQRQSADAGSGYTEIGAPDGHSAHALR